MTVKQNVVWTDNPLHFEAPKEVDGRKENVEDFSFKLKSHLRLMNPAFTAIRNNTEAALNSPVTEACFIDDGGNVQAARVQ